MSEINRESTVKTIAQPIRAAAAGLRWRDLCSIRFTCSVRIHPLRSFARVTALSIRMLDNY